MRALRSCADALVSALFLVVVESLLVALVFHRELAGAWELRQALRVLPAIGWVTVAPLAVVGALLLAGMRRGVRRRWRPCAAPTGRRFMDTFDGGGIRPKMPRI